MPRVKFKAGWRGYGSGDVAEVTEMVAEALLAQNLAESAPEPELARGTPPKQKQDRQLKRAPHDRAVD